MKAPLSILFLSILLFSNTFAQKKIGGVMVDDFYTYEGTKMVLNGAGVREKLFIDLYVAAIYLKQKTQDPKKLVDADELTVLKITIVSDLITKQKMEETIREGFKKSAGANIGNFQSRIDVFIKVITEDLKKGANYTIIFNPASKNTLLYKEGTLKSIVQGLDFKKVLLGIWLGPSPVDEPLKNKLLGK